MAEKPNNTLLILLVLLIGAWTLWPAGCSTGFAGLEFATWLGKLTVRPVRPATPKLVIPKTRCLIFGFSSCPACRELHKTVRRLDGWKLGPLPTDDIEEIDIYSSDRRINKYKHSSYPTLIIVDRAEKEVARKTGAMSAKELITWIQSTR